ncbi:unnamed protein product [Larinioides sclopetarius]|uniref:Uncharacterized protein n=1 Tax=Larinioides sclopetarius TaxID=280406 RepID=A0AAV1ZKB0_9ARAC
MVAAVNTQCLCGILSIQITCRNGKVEKARDKFRNFASFNLILLLQVPTWTGIQQNMTVKHLKGN